MVLSFLLEADKYVSLNTLRGPDWGPPYFPVSEVGPPPWPFPPAGTAQASASIFFSSSMWSSLLIRHIPLSHCDHYLEAACVLSRFSRVWVFVALWTVAHPAPLSKGFSRQECWSRLPFPSPEALPDPGIKLESCSSLHWQAGSLSLAPAGNKYLRLRTSKL